MEGKFANVIINISHEKLDRPFQYLIPRELRGRILPGTCVSVPFGAGNRLKKGYVLEVTDRPQLAPERLKQIAAVEEKDMMAEGRCMELAGWMRERYGSTMITALKTVLPVKKKVRNLEERSCSLLLSAGEAQALLADCDKKGSTAKARLLRGLLQADPLPMPFVTGRLHISSQTIKSLEKQGAIRISSSSSYRNPVGKLEKTADARRAAYGRPKALSEEQRRTAEDILKNYDAGRRDTCLIHGITGSGKTEVYLALIGEMVKRGKQAIVLIPEIALTYQTLLRFYMRFGNRVSVLNSSLSMGEKYDQCERAKKGDIDVIIGPRSALFTPFPNLGLIVIDEEHEATYKSESMPRYHARETAEKIASMQDAFVVLGSATPSLESYYRAKKGSYRLYELTARQAGGELPTVHTVDLREELRAGNRSVFSRRLEGLIRDRLEKKEQSILFLNRRGYAGFVSCRSCGYVMKCPHCDVSLSEHKGGRLVCHYCGYGREGVRACPQCGSRYILGFRAGTQQVEEMLHREFPSARVLRMDADTTRRKESFEEILGTFANGEADILLGTQMIVKGHDFPNVTLVGVLAADLSLHVNDYRAGERTFQLLAQAAGRAGRGGKPGEVVIQTYDPEHYCIRHAARQDYKGFYEEEMVYREMMLYPPAAHMLAVITASPAEKKAAGLAEEIAGRIRGAFSGEGPGHPRQADPEGLSAGIFQVIGPAPASIGKLQDIYRFVLYVKSPAYERLIEVKDMVEAMAEQMKGNNALKNEVIQFDFDPLRGY